MSSRAALEQAIEWSACLRDESLLPSERHAFEHWLQADPLNAQAWNTVQSHVQRSLAPAHDAQARRALQAPRPSRRQLLRGALAVAGLGVVTQALRQPGMPLAEFGADLRTGTGERLNTWLADGSHLVLDAQSAVDIDWRTDERRLLLRAGKIILDIHHEPRPFNIRTPFGQVQGNGTRLMVAAYASFTHVWALGPDVHITTRRGAQLTLKADQGARFNDSIERLAANHSGESSWQDGWLNVQDWALGDVIAALKPYRRGVLRVSPSAASMRVSGVFSLDHSDRALAALAQTMPLRIQRYGEWWVSVDRA